MRDKGEAFVPAAGLQNLFHRVVVVNDSPTQLNLLCALLKKEDLIPVPFDSAETALAAMEQISPPALIITDLYMPGIDGWRFCRLLRSPEYVQFNQVPILVVSATFSGPEPSLITTNLGANAFLPMPIDREQFNEQVQALLKGETSQDFLKVLIVEGDETLSNRMVRAFQVQGYLADAAFSYQEGLFLAGQTAYDVVVLADILPDGAGERLLKDLRVISPGSVSMIMAADPQPQFALAWMKMGAAGYVQKPFAPEYLIDQCERAYHEHSLLRIQDVLEVRTRQLQESEARFHNAMAASNDGIWEWDIPNEKIYYSPAYLAMLGYLPDEFPPSLNTWINLLHPDDRQAAIAANQASIDDETGVLDSEFRMLARDGSWRWIRSQGKVLKRDGNGRALQMVGTNVDVTNHKQAVEKLRENELKLSMIFNKSRDAIGVSYEGTHIMVNPAYVAMFGYESEGQVLKTPVLDLIGPSQRLHIMDQIQRRARKEKVADYYETTGLRKDGSEFDMEVTVSPYELKGDTYTLVVIRDNTDRNRAKQVLRESEERFRSIFENIPVGMFQTTTEEKFIYVNPAFASMLGYTSPEELMQVVKQTSIANALYENPSQRPRLVQQVEPSAGHWNIFENRYRRKDGTIIDGILSYGERADPVTGQRFLYGFVEDITGRKQAENQIGDQLEELRRWHNITLGREERILQLKSEVNRLLVEAGQPPRYSSAGGVGLE